MDCKAAARSDVGNVRERNEDSYLVDEDNGLFVVADGMGGGIGGDVASQILVETLEADAGSIARAARSRNPANVAEDREHLLKLLTSSFLEANREIFNTGEGEMGTTGEAVFLTDRAALIAHVGDSRTYLIREGTVQRLTSDHNFEEPADASDSGRADDVSEGSHDDYGHILTRTIGGKPHVRVDTIYITLQPGDRLLLCTDGLSNHIERSQISALAEVDGPDKFVDGLVQRVRASGGLDDSTAVAVDLPESEAFDSEEPDSIDTSKKVQILRQLALFDGVDDRTILQLLRHVFTVDFEEGEQIIEQGAEERSMYVLVSGTAEVRREGERLAEISPGNHVGEMALVDEGPRSAEVIAIEPVTALVISPDEFDEMIRRIPAVGNRILSNLLKKCTERLRRTNEVLLIDEPDQPND